MVVSLAATLLAGSIHSMMVMVSRERMSRLIVPIKMLVMMLAVMLYVVYIWRVEFNNVNDNRPILYMLVLRNAE